MVTTSGGISPESHQLDGVEKLSRRQRSSSFVQIMAQVSGACWRLGQTPQEVDIEGMKTKVHKLSFSPVSVARATALKVHLDA